MSINKEGFLSPDVQHFITRHYARFEREFSLARDLNSVAQAMLMATKLEPDSPEPNAEYLIALMFTRALSNFQGAILMVERGMIPEGRTLTRACFESASCVCAASNGGESFVQKMLAAEQDARRRFANWTLSRPEVLSHAGEGTKDKLEKYLSDTSDEEAQALQWEQVARAGGIGSLYVFYRLLSGDAAHAGIGALERYFDKTNTGGERIILWGPDHATPEIGDTLLHAVCFMLTACAAFNNTVLKDSFHRELSPFLTRYTDLLNELGSRMAENVTAT